MSRARSLANLANSGVFSADASTSRVGINSTAPTRTLDVDGDGRVSGTLSIGGTINYEDVTSIDSIGVVTARQGVHIVSAGASIYSPANNELALYTNSSERVRVESGGNIGIGTNNPNNLFHVYGGQIKAQSNPSDTSTNLDLIRAQCGPTGNALFSIRAADAADNNSNWDIKTSANEDLTFTIGGSTERLRLLSDGKIGVGTTIPEATLQVNQPASDQSGAAAIKAIGTAYGTNKAIHSYMDTTNSNKSLLYVENGSGVVMNVAGDGNVGIGTQSPLGTLHTSGNSANLVGAFLENRADAGSSDSVSLNFVLRRAGGYQFGIPAIKAEKENAWTGTPSTINSSLVFSTIGNESSSARMRIKSDGRVGVGIDPPETYYFFSMGNPSAGTYPLYIRGSNNQTLFELYESSIGDGRNAFMWMSNGSGDRKIQLSTSGTTYFTGGDVLVGKTTFDLQSNGIELRSNANGGTFLVTQSGNGLPCAYFNQRYGAGTQSAAQFYYGTSHVASITVTSTGGAFTSHSDYRLKENVVPINDGIDRVKQLKPSRFNFIVEPTITVDGFLAHEAQTVVPEAITGEHNGLKVWKDSDELPQGVSIGDYKLDEDGNTIPEYQGMDQSKLVPLLTAALQEAIAKIETLEQRLSDAGIA